MRLHMAALVARILVEHGLAEFSPGMGIDEIQDEYNTRVYGAMDDYTQSNRTVVSYRNEYNRINNDAYLLAAVAGWVDAGASGSLPDSIVEYVNTEVGRQSAYVDDVFTQLKTMRGDGTSADDIASWIQQRADGYTASIKTVYDYAMVVAAAEIPLTFDGDDGSEDSVCQKIGGMCVKLKGQTHPASWWIEQDLIPYRGNGNYDCGGWNCRHYLQDNNGKVWASANQ